MPKLKRTYNTKDEIPADIYVEKDGKFVLSDVEVEGFVPAATLDEFRNTNIQLRKDLEKFEGVDPEKYRDLSSRETQIKDAETKGAEKIEQRVTERTKEALSAWEKEKAKLSGDLQTARAKLQKAVIESRALELATPFGLRKDAARNLILLVNEQWTLDDHGDPIAFEGDGRTARIDGSGKPMRGTEGLQRFIEKLAKEDAKFLFEPNSGGGAGNDGGAGHGGGDGGGDQFNPFDPKTWNRTKQTKMIKENFDLARRMAARHGIDLKPSSVTVAR